MHVCGDVTAERCKTKVNNNSQADLDASGHADELLTQHVGSSNGGYIISLNTRQQQRGTLAIWLIKGLDSSRNVCLFL